MRTKIISAAIATLLLSTPMLATASDCNYADKAMKTNYSAGHNQGGFIKVGAHAKMDIVDTAVKAGSFNTLVAAVKAAGLVETLKGEGPFTVFAPTDEAFAKIPADALNSLLADKEALRKVLLYHVVAGKVTAGQVVTLKSAKTVQGSEVMVDASSGVKINDATVVKADVMTSNGVIHAIDTVLMPK
ncbi:MAG: fasciclin domain-containing protein [Cocleimonas sp.]